MSVRRIAIVACFIVAIFGLVFAAYGGGWSGGASRGSLTVNVTGWGLGKLTAVRVAAQMSGYAVCQNYGGNVAPGQTLVTVDLPGKETTQLTDRNGKVSATFHWQDAELLEDITWEDAGCPNSNWSVIDILSNHLTIDVWEIEGTAAIERTAGHAECTMDPPANTGDFDCVWS